MPSSGPQGSKGPGWLQTDARLPSVILPKRTLGRGADVFRRTEVEQCLRETLRGQNVPMHGKAPCLSPPASKAISHSYSTGPVPLSSCPDSRGAPGSQSQFRGSIHPLGSRACQFDAMWNDLPGSLPRHPSNTSYTSRSIWLRDQSFKVRMEEALLSHSGDLASGPYGMLYIFGALLWPFCALFWETGSRCIAWYIPVIGMEL